MNMYRKPCSQLGSKEHTNRQKNRSPKAMRKYTCCDMHSGTRHSHERQDEVRSCCSNVHRKVQKMNQSRYMNNTPADPKQT